MRKPEDPVRSPVLKAHIGWARVSFAKTLSDAGVTLSFYGIVHAQHAFLRVELSEGRYELAVSGMCFAMLLKLFAWVLRAELGPRVGEGEVVDVWEW
ncbi:MAG: hypothetical protein LQ340_007148 [Diploschistes diacapsis]|nr:MAG: hypothetical protein LQ340_007148 [Diploschistes diacapsis]